MKKNYFTLFLFLFPCLLYSQFLVEKGYQISSIIKPIDLNRKDSVGIYIAKGGFDINKNGKKEIIALSDPNLSGGTTRDTSSTIFWLENDGADKYKLLWSYTMPATSKWPSYRGYGDIAVGDVDKDGYQEIWIGVPSMPTASQPNPDRIFIFEFDGTKMPATPTASWNLGVRDNMRFMIFNLILEDVDNDNEIEIITQSRRDDYTGTDKGRTLIIGSLGTPLEQDGLNIILQEFIDTSSVLKGGALYDLKVVDFDNNGKKEIWVFTWDKLTINIYESPSPHLYTNVANVKQVFGQISYSQPQGDLGSFNGATFYDANGDGKLECFISGIAGEGDGEEGGIIYLKSVDDVKKLDKTKTDYKSYFKLIGYLSSGGTPYGATVGDFDKDGKMDFVFVDRRNNKLMKMEYKGTGDLGDSLSYDWTNLYVDTCTGTLEPDYINVTSSSSDMDGDGYPEILLSNLDVGNPSRPMVVILEATKAADVKRIDNAIPEKHTLAQNYPNPFNPNTTIEFSIPKSSNVTMRIFNLLGQEVMKVLDNVKKDAGNYRISFNAANLPSGSYFYSLETGDFSTKKKMIILK
jgi:hypothetical protein